jgi:phosphoribosyl 1,2-cyclic phosphodiesterase
MSGKLSDGSAVEIRKYRTSLLVETNERHRILVDCGPDFSRQMRDYFPTGIINAIVITHPHLDHIGGLDELNLYKTKADEPPKIPTFATKACWDCIKTQRGLGYVIDIGLVTEKLLSLKENERSFSEGSVTITPFSVEHSPIAPGAVGFVFEEIGNGQTKRVLYTGDLWAVSKPDDPLFRQQFDVAIIECDRWEKLAGPAVGGGHMSCQEAVRMLKDGVFSNPRPTQVVFVHFGDYGPNGTGSAYQHWRDAVIDYLDTSGLRSVMPDEDKVIGYEGLTLQV